jgi:hypothetical protein
MQLLLEFLKNFYKIREISAFAVNYYLYVCEIYTKILYHKVICLYTTIFTTHTVQYSKVDVLDLNKCNSKNLYFREIIF